MNATIEGELESLGGNGFEGWAWDSSKPYDPVEVEVVCNGVVIARAVADGFSLDLVKQRKGNGMHSFAAMPRTLPKMQYPLRVSARVAGQETPLSGEITVKAPAEFFGILPKSLFQDFEGYVDGIKDGFVVGWVINTLIPDEPVEVELLDGTQSLGMGLANRFRADVEKHSPGTGNSGFELALPYDLLDGQLHNLRVKVAGTQHELQNSPISFGPSSVHGLIREVLRLREETADLRKQLAAAAGTERLETFSRSLIGRFEALYSIQRDAFEREIQTIRTVALGLPSRAAAEPLPAVIPAEQREPEAAPAGVDANRSLAANPHAKVVRMISAATPKPEAVMGTDDSLAQSPVSSEEPANAVGGSAKPRRRRS